MGSTEEHQQLVNEIHLKIGSMTGVRLWKQINGVFRDLYSDRIIRVGLPGSFDLTGIIKSGRRLELEIKTGKAKLSKDQITFQKMIRGMGGIAEEIRNLDDAIQIVKTALCP